VRIKYIFLHDFAAYFYSSQSIIFLGKKILKRTTTDIKN